MRRASKHSSVAFGSAKKARVQEMLDRFREARRSLDSARIRLRSNCRGALYDLLFAEKRLGRGQELVKSIAGGIDALSPREREMYSQLNPTDLELDLSLLAKSFIDRCVVEPKSDRELWTEWLAGGSAKRLRD
jgi:hypothetical protein